MKVYITYFRYDRGENYSIYHIDLYKKSSINHFKTTDLPSFLSYGPDDVSYLVLKEVEMSKKDFNTLILLSEKKEDYDNEVIDFMDQIHDGDGDEIFYTSGDEVWEVLEFFKTSGNYDLDSMLGCDTDSIDDDDLKEMCQEKLFDDDDLFDEVLKDYIKIYY